MKGLAHGRQAVSRSAASFKLARMCLSQLTRMQTVLLNPDYTPDQAVQLQLEILEAAAIPPGVAYPFSAIDLAEELFKTQQQLAQLRTSHQHYVSTMKDCFAPYAQAREALSAVLLDPTVNDEQARRLALSIVENLPIH